MSGGHWDYSGLQIQDKLDEIADDEAVKQRWPRIGQLFRELATIIYDAVHDMDWDLSVDSLIQDDKEFEDQVCYAVLELAMKVADEKLFPRGKWATIQAIRERRLADEEKKKE